jgi:hypothetical protein
MASAVRLVAGPGLPAAEESVGRKFSKSEEWSLGRRFGAGSEARIPHTGWQRDFSQAHL